MSNHIISEPFVTVTAESKLTITGLEEFAHQENLESALEADTPISKIYDHALGDSEEFTHAELIPEFGGRFCYHSWEKGRSTPEYNHNILEMEHGSVLEHSTLSFIITGVSRSLTHELVRHRAGIAFSQESQRYVDMANVNFVMPPLLLNAIDGDLTCGEAEEWLNEQMAGVQSYNKWQSYLTDYLGEQVENGSIALDPDIASSFNSWEKKVHKQLTRVLKRANEAARASLPNSTETKLLCTANLRTLRHFIMLRGGDPADLEIRRLAVVIARRCKEFAPTIFADIEIVPGTFGVETVVGKFRKV